MSDQAVTPAAGRPRSVQSSLAAIVLVTESFIMCLATLVIFGLNALPPLAALLGGALLCVALVVTAGLAMRFRWAIPVGWALQVCIALTTIILPLMGIVAAIFIAMWVYCMIRGSRIDRDNAAAAQS